MLHKNTRGEGVTPSSTLPSRIGTGGGAKHKRSEGSLRSAARRATIRRARKNRAAPLGMTAERRGKRNPRTDLKIGHYTKKESGPPQKGASTKERKTPCSEGQRDALGEYRPSERSTPSAREGVLGDRQKAHLAGSTRGRCHDSSAARPDAPQIGAEEKVGPLRSE